MPPRKVLLLFTWHPGDDCTYGPSEDFIGVVSSLGQATGKLRKIVHDAGKNTLWLPRKWVLKEAETDGGYRDVYEWEPRDLRRHGKKALEGVDPES